MNGGRVEQASAAEHNSTARITCVIVAYGAYAMVDRAGSSALNAGATDVYIWDNTPAHSVEELAISENPAVHVLRDGTNWGFGGGVNRAVAHLDAPGPGDLLLLLNPDAMIEAESLQSICDEASRRNGIAAPRMLYPSGAYGIAGGPAPSLLKEILAATELDRFLPPSFRRLALNAFRSKSSTSFGASLASGPSVDMDWVSGFCMVMPRQVFDALHGFDETFFLYFEDVDLCLRAHAAGFPVRLVRQAHATHDESATTSRAGKSSHYRTGRSQYFAKHGGWATRRVARLMASMTKAGR